MIKGKSTQEIRSEIRRQRRQLDVGTQHENSLSICAHIRHAQRYRNADKLALYLANDGEIDPHLICEHAWNNGKRVYLPILSPLNNSLHFAPYTPDSELQLNRFNIPEPVCAPAQWINARQLDVLLLPLVAFDDQGNRIGMGGGFYDRTLAYRQHGQHPHKPTLIGLAHELQKTQALATQNWDIPLDYILTETGLREARA